MSVKDHPGVYIPPPLIYAGAFFLSIALQRLMPINSSWLSGNRIAGLFCIACYLIFFLPAIIRFIRSKNTLVTIKPASSLETSGIYSFTRNPMYLSLLFLYSGIAFFKGNAWTFLLIPVLILAVQSYVISKEEKYLLRTFGNDYVDYRKRVRRWL